MTEDERKTQEIVERTAQQVREITTSEYYQLFELLRRPKKLMWLNFLIGLARGFGLAIGLTVLGGLAIAFLTVMIRKLVSVPVLGQYITEIVNLVRANMGH